MIFNHWTYNQFWLARLSLDAQPIHFIKDEIEWALKQIDYKYFGDYEFSDQQKMAVDIIEWAAKEYLKNV